jgi:hypothetical protein
MFCVCCYHIEGQTVYAVCVFCVALTQEFCLFYRFSEYTPVMRSCTDNGGVSLQVSQIAGSLNDTDKYIAGKYAEPLLAVCFQLIKMCASVNHLQSRSNLCHVHLIYSLRAPRLSIKEGRWGSECRLNTR